MDAVEPAVDQAGDLSLERFPGNGVHATSRAFEPASPRRQRLTITKRSPNTMGTGTSKSFPSSGCHLGNQAGRAPVASTTGIGKPRCRNGLKVNPTGNVTAEPMTIPQALVAEGLHLEQNRGVARHYSGNTVKPTVGVLDDVRECDRFRHELVGRLAGWLEHHQRASRRCLGGQHQGAARQAIQEEHRRAGERRL